MSRVSLAFSSFILLSLDHYSLNKRWTVSLHPRLPHRVSTITPSTICGILYWNCFSSSMWMVLSTPISLTSTWPKSHYLVTLFLTYCVTRRRCSSLHDDTLGTTVHTILFLEWHHCHPRDIDIRNDFKVEAHILAVWFRALMRYPNTRLPSTGILISLDDANLTCIVTIANAYDFATTSVPPWRVFQVWCRTHLWVSTRDPWWMWNCTCSEERSVFLFTDSYRWFSSCTRSRPTLVVLSARARPQVFLFTRRGSVGEALHCCFGWNSSTLLEFHRLATWWACAQGFLWFSVHQVRRLSFLLELVLLIFWCLIWSTVLASTGLDQKDLDSAVSFWTGVTDEHPLFQRKRFSRPLRLGIYFTNILILSVGFPFSRVRKCWCGIIATRFSQVAQRDCHDLPFLPPGCTFFGGNDICMLSVPSSTCDLHNSCWQGGWWPLPGDSCWSLYVVQLRTVIFRQMRMISFLSSLAVLPTCFLLHDSRFLGLTLRPSAPVSCCHRVSLTRGRLAFSEEAVRACSLLLFLLNFFCSCWFLQGHSGSHRVNSLQAALKGEGFATT